MKDSRLLWSQREDAAFAAFCQVKRHVLCENSVEGNRCVWIAMSELEKDRYRDAVDAAVGALYSWGCAVVHPWGVKAS